jgi:hypothetical protein
MFATVAIVGLRLSIKYRLRRRYLMPVRKVNGGYKWGATGKVYKSRARAEKQGRAIKAAQARRRKKKKEDSDEA